MPRHGRLAAALVMAIVAVAVIAARHRAQTPAPGIPSPGGFAPRHPPSPSPPPCAACHAAEADAWASSHHARAMRDREDARAVFPEPTVVLDTATGLRALPIEGAIGVAPLVQPIVTYGGKLHVAARAWDVTK